MGGKILMVDDDPSGRTMMALMLKAEGHSVETAADGAEAIARLNDSDQPFDLVVTDLQMEPVSGLDVVQTARAMSNPPEVIVLTGYGSIDSAVEAIKHGAFDYLTKAGDPEATRQAVRKALAHAALAQEVRSLRALVAAHSTTAGVIAEAPAMRRVLDLVRRVAPTDATVLITGESGTGKEVVAQSIHRGSRRAGRPFIPINCGALPESLLESELFGHVKGAYTGAFGQKKGLFEEASGGTLLLDEVGEMTPAVQVKLLRVLQEGEVRRVGENRSTKVDVRVLAATNQDLAAMVASGKFREDLYYRLKVIPVHLPPLRERREDILPLAHHFLRRHRDQLGIPVSHLSPQAVARMLDYAWPGNVRELSHTVEHAVILSTDDVIGLDDLPMEVSGRQPTVSAARPSPAPAESAAENNDEGVGATLEAVEQAHILRTLAGCNHNQALAARTLGISRTTLWKKLKDYGVSSPPTEPEA